MLPYLLIMIIYTYKGSSTIQQQLPDQNTCLTIMDNISGQVSRAGGSVYSQGCYQIPGGNN